MKKLLTALTLALLASLALSIGAGVAGATHSDGQGPNKDFVTGTGQFLPETLDLEIHVNAMSGPSGEDPKGHFFVRQAEVLDIDFRGEVTCLRVDGNRATIGGEITQARAGDEILEGRGILLFVEDNGEGSNDSLDRANVRITGSPPRTCPPPTLPPPRFEKGNYTVHDATP